MSDTVKLRTGIDAHRGLVMVTMTTLHHLVNTAPQVAYDAMEMARTGEPQFHAERLEKLGLTQGGVMHQATREIIRAATEGEGLEMTLINPIEVQAG